MKRQWAAVCLGLLLGLPVWGDEPKAVKSAEDEPKTETPAPRPVKLELSDGKLPLRMLRAMDRRIHVISLNVVWKKPALAGVSYQLTVRFPNGQTYSHRPINDSLFSGKVAAFMVPEYVLIRTGAVRGGKLELFVTERLAGATDDPISNTVELSWPLDRPSAGKDTPPRTIDAAPNTKK